jgi:hypothetical protein
MNAPDTAESLGRIAESIECVENHLRARNCEMILPMQITLRIEFPALDNLVSLLRAESFGLLFGKPRKAPMSLRLQTGFKADFKIYAKTGSAPAGATFAVTSSDPAVSVTTDPTPQPVANGEGAGATPPVADGTPSLVSGTVTAVGTVDGVVATIQCVQTNPDGTTLSISDTVTVSDTETLGELFGLPVSATPVAA